MEELYKSGKKYYQICPNNVQVSVVNFSGEYGTHIIFCHATGRHKELYLKHIALLRAKGYKGSVTILDARDHGDTKLIENQSHDWWLSAQDVLVVLSQLRKNSKLLHGENVQPENYIAIGHSMGGAVCLMAEILGAGFKKVIAFEPVSIPFIILPDEVYAKQNPLIRSVVNPDRKILFETFDKLKEFHYNHDHFKSWDRDVLECFVTYGFKKNEKGYIHKCAPKNEADTFKSGYQSGLHGMLKLINIPVRIHHSSEKMFVNMIKEDYFHDCKIHSFAHLGADHSFPFKEPGLWVDQILKEISDEYQVCQQCKL